VARAADRRLARAAVDGRQLERHAALALMPVRQARVAQQKAIHIGVHLLGHIAACAEASFKDTLSRRSMQQNAVYGNEKEINRGEF
jgi:hypothetical protein